MEAAAGPAAASTCELREHLRDRGVDHSMSATSLLTPLLTWESLVWFILTRTIREKEFWDVVQPGLVDTLLNHYSTYPLSLHSLDTRILSLGLKPRSIWKENAKCVCARVCTCMCVCLCT